MNLPRMFFQRRGLRNSHHCPEEEERRTALGRLAGTDWPLKFGNETGQSQKMGKLREPFCYLGWENVSRAVERIRSSGKALMGKATELETFKTESNG